MMKLNVFPLIVPFGYYDIQSLFLYVRHNYATFQFSTLPIDIEDVKLGSKIDVLMQQRKP